MKLLRRFLSRFTASATHHHDDQALREELEQHLALQTDDNIRAGLPPDEARRRAVLKFGAIESIKESYRDERRLAVVEDVLQDARLAIRQLRQAPLFTLVAALSLAMGIGANAAVFSVIERVLLRTLPVVRPHELVYVTDERILTQPSPRFSYPFFAAVRDNTILEGMAARAGATLNATVNGQTVRVGGEFVSGTYFSVLGTSVQIGRSLSPDDDRIPGAHPVAVISDRFWRRTFASDASVIGRNVQINGRSLTIIGVAAEGFTGTDIGGQTDIWLPMMMSGDGRNLLGDARTNWLEMIGRLSSGMARDRAADELTRHLQRRATDLPAGKTAVRLVLVAGDKGSSAVRTQLGPALGVLMLLTTLALGLACVNVASLVAVRSAARQKEMAIRLALGAGRARLSRQLLTEGLMLAAIGGLAGLLTAPWATRMLIASQPLSLDIDASLNFRVLLFTLAASVVAGLLVALAPIVASRRVTFSEALERAVARPGAATRRPTAHDLIVSLQIAMALAMLISAALFVQSLRGLQGVDPGFRADNLLLVPLDPKTAGYEADRIDGYWRNTLARVKRIPGVQSASLAGTVPLAPTRQRQPWTNMMTGEKLELDTNFVGPGYFHTLDIPLLRGREFNEQDGRTTRLVVVVNERFAQLFWPDADPIGRGLRLPGARDDSRASIAEVVGLVRDAKYRDLRSESGPMIYRPVLQTHSTDSMTLHVRTSSDPAALVSAIRAELHEIDRNVPVHQVTTLEEQLDRSFAQTRQAALLTGTFGVIALLLSGIGVYGVTALAVSRRTRDIGIRMALGAQRRDIIRAIGRRGLTLVVAGLALGVLGSFGFTQLTGTLLFGVTPADSATFAGIAALMGAVSLIGFAIPVRRATRLNVVAAIRS